MKFSYLISKRIFSIAIFVFSLGGFLCFVRTDVQAVLKGSSKYEVDVRLLPNGTASVEYVIHLVNESDKFFIRDYSLLTDYSDVFGLRVLENGSLGDFRKEHIEDKVRIKVLLQEPLVNYGDKGDICIKYQTRQIFQKDGLISSLYVPYIRTEEDLISVDFTLAIPNEIGDISYISLKDKSYTEYEQSKVFRYSREDAPSGVLFLFGDKQQFDFIYNYRLDNDTDKLKNFNITLPPESEFQKPFFIDTQPVPERTLSDQDGNNIVEYSISPKESKDIRIAGVTIFTLDEEQKGWEVSVTSDYLEESDIWNFSSDNVRSVINNITRKDFSPFENAELIYEYLILNFNYGEKDTPRRMDAVSLLQEKPLLSCQNFSDLFIALARGAGILSREVIGYSSWSKSQVGLHTWVEFYDTGNNRWVACDPCLEKQLGFLEFEDIDLNRIILAYRDNSSEDPQVVIPFLDFQGLSSDSLEIRTSPYEYTDEGGSIDFDYKVGRPDLFFRYVPIKLNILNNSKSIFRFDKVFIDNQEVDFMQQYLDKGYFEAIFPGQLGNFMIDLSQLGDFSIERIENYHLEVYGKFGSNIFEQKEEFEVSRPITWFHAATWFMAGILAFLTIIWFLFIVKKIRSKPLRKRPKYKHRFRKSKIKGLLDVPISLR